MTAQKDFIESKAEFMRMFNDLCQTGIKPSVAMLALISTDFTGTEAATAWIYDAEEDPAAPHNAKMRHPFVGCLPPTE